MNVSSFDLLKFSSVVWNQLREEWKIYEILVPRFSKLKRKSKLARRKVWNAKKKPTDRAWSWYGRHHGSAFLLQVKEIWINPKANIKIIIAGEHRDYYSILTTQARGIGFCDLEQDEHPNIFNNIKIGTWLIAPKNRWNPPSSLNVAFITDEPQEKKVREMLDDLEKIRAIQEKYSDLVADWHEFTSLVTDGKVTYQEICDFKTSFFIELRKSKWKERKDRWDHQCALNNKISMTDNGTIWRMEVKGAVDGNNWILEGPSAHLGIAAAEIYLKDFWTPMVYFDKKRGYMWLKKATAQEQSEYLFNHIFSAILRNEMRECTWVFQVNKRKVTVTRKETKNGSQLHYLNGELMKWNSLRNIMESYLLKGRALPVTVTKKGRKKKTKMLSEEAQGLIDKGLNGKIQDLEGTFPFHLNIIYLNKKWFIEIGGKKFYIKGGYLSLKKVQSAIEGTAIVKGRPRYGYNRYDSTVILNRLAKVMGRKDALWIILKVKKLGALMKAISP